MSRVKRAEVFGCSMCFGPITLKRKTKTFNDRLTDVVPCGTCPECLSKKRNQWAMRLMHEYAISKSATWATFTYNEECVPKSFNGYHTVNKEEIQKFIKVLRYHAQDNANPIKYYLAAEYGEKSERPHYHALLFNMDLQYIKYPHRLENLWGKGKVYQGTVSEASVRYTMKYMLKASWEPKHELDDRDNIFRLMSKGLGLGWLNERRKNHIAKVNMPYMIGKGGVKLSLPRIYKEKIWEKELKTPEGESIKVNYRKNVKKYIDSRELTPLEAYERVEYQRQKVEEWQNYDHVINTVL